MDNDALAEMFAGLGPVSIRRLFGGKGIYHKGLIVGIVLKGELLLKADAISGPHFAAAGATQWSYTGRRHGKTVAMPYWSIPDSAVDDPDELSVWTNKAYEAAVRSAEHDSPI